MDRAFFQADCQSALRWDDQLLRGPVQIQSDASKGSAVARARSADGAMARGGPSTRGLETFGHLAGRL